MISAVLAPAAALVASAALTPLVRAFARRIGAVAQPKLDRWHSKPTAMMGGVAVYMAVLATLITCVPQKRENWIVLATSSAMFLLGLVDDFVHMKPYQKLIGQLLASTTVVYLGLVLPWTGSYVINMFVTFFWLVGVTNAVNMLDNMDGLAPGVSAIAAVFLAGNFVMNGQAGEAIVLAVFAAALIGFLIYNHNPASIFMGDCGSMFVGFFLASAALLAVHSGGGRSRSVIAVLAVPVLVLCIPIFDTTFVTLMRKLAGRAASTGGRDHTSHRLVALGLSEKQAVWMLYGFATVAGALSLIARRLELDVSVAVLAVFTVGMALLGVYLAGVRVYSPEEIATARQRPIVSFLVDLSYKRRIFEVFLDVVLIVLSYYGSYALLFGPATAASGDWSLFLATLPTIIFIKLSTFLVAGVYRGLWRYAGLSDVVRYARAVGVSSALSVLMIVFAFRFVGFSRTAFVLDALLLFVLMTGSRFALRVMRRLIPTPHVQTGKRVLIFGAGDGGELTLREILNNSGLRYIPVAFVDDDVIKSGKYIHGKRVHPGTEHLGEVCRRLAVDEVFVSTAKVTTERLRRIVSECADTGVVVRRMRIVVETLSEPEMAWVLPSPASTVSEAPAMFLHVPPRSHTVTSDH